MVELTPEEEHFYATSPITVVYDIFSDTATRLSGKYVALSRRATTGVEREQWWRKVLELKRLRKSIDPDDRETLVAHIRQWNAEFNRLRER